MKWSEVAFGLQKISPPSAKSAQTGRVRLRAHPLILFGPTSPPASHHASPDLTTLVTGCWSSPTWQCDEELR